MFTQKKNCEKYSLKNDIYSKISESVENFTTEREKVQHVASAYKRDRNTRSEMRDSETAVSKRSPQRKLNRFGRSKFMRHI